MVYSQRKYKHAHDTGLTKKCSRPIVRFNLLTQEKEKEYESILEATKELGVDSSSIVKVCNKKQWTAGGFGWTYKGEEDTIKNKACVNNFVRFLKFKVQK